MDQTSIFNKSKKEFTKALYSGQIDKNIIPLLTKLNSNEKIATRFSCEGHLDEERSYFYIQFTENKNADLLIEIYNNLREALNNYNLGRPKETFYLVGLQLTFGTSLNENNINIRTITIEYDPALYLGGAVFKSEYQKLIFIELFYKSIGK